MGRKTLILISIVTFSVMFSISMVGPLLGVLINIEGIYLGRNPNFSLGLIFAFEGLTLSLLQLPFSNLSNRFGRRIFIVLGSIIVGISVASIGFSAVFARVIGDPVIGEWSLSACFLALFRTLQGVGGASTWPILMALIPLIYSEESLGMAMGVFGASFGLGMALGPVIGPGLAAVTSVYIPFLFASALAMASAVLALKLPDYRGSDIVKHVFKIPNDRNILLLSIVGFSLMFSMGTLVVIYPKFLLDVLGFSVRELAVLLSLASLTFAFLQPLFGKLSDKVGRRKLIPMGLGVTFIAMLGVAFSTSFSMISIMMFLFGVSGAVIFPSATGLLGERSTSSTVGTNSGFFNMMVSLGVTVAPIVVGLTSDIFGYTMGFLVPPILLVIGLISSLLVR